MNQPKGKLFQIARDCKKYNPKEHHNKKTPEKVNISGSYYDDGRAINLSYNVDLYRQNIYDAYRHDDPATQLSFMDELRSQTFYVEPFEDDTIEVQHEEVNDEEEKLLDKVVQNKNDQDEKEPEKQTVSGEGTGGGSIAGTEEGYKSTPGKNLIKDEQDLTAEEKNPVQKLPDEPEEQLKDDQAEDHQIEDDEFANDIKDILQGKKLFHPDKKKTVTQNEISPADQLASRQKKDYNMRENPEEATLDPAKNEHKIFEKIAKSMRYANSYDLGSIAMEKRFDQLEKEMEEAEIKAITSNPVKEAPEKKPLDEPQEAVITEEKQVSLKEEVSSEDILSPGNGARIIDGNNLLTGDILLFTDRRSGEDERNISKCYGGVYVGENNMLLAEENRIIQKRSLDNLKERQPVVLRHKNINENIRHSIIEKAEEYKPKDSSEPMVAINYAPIEIHESVCSSLPDDEKIKCRSFKGKIDIGTLSNDTFFMALPLVELQESSGIKMLDKELTAPASDVILKANIDGQLKYAGHLKSEKSQS